MVMYTLICLLYFQDLVSKMLAQDPEDRLSAEEVQEHVWISVSKMNLYHPFLKSKTLAQTMSYTDEGGIK